MNNLSEHTDEQLVRLVQSALRSEPHRANEAFAILYSRHEQRVRLYALRMLGCSELASDIVQETFVRLYRTIADGTTIQQAGGYIIRTARNLCFNLKRDTKKTIRVDDLEIAMPVQSGFGHANYETNELMEIIGIALDCLDDDYKEAFVLRYYSEMSYEEIAELTATTATNAASRVFRAKEKLKHLLAPYRVDLGKMTN